MKVAEIFIANVFSLYRKTVKREGYTGTETANTCVRCESWFNIKTFGSNATLYCPRCGSQHTRHQKYCDEAKVPKQVRMWIDAYKTVVSLKIEYTAFQEKINEMEYLSGREEFRFDAVTRRTTWREGTNFRSMSKPIDITNLFDTTGLQKKSTVMNSVLYHINNDSIPLVDKEKRKEMVGFIAKLRSTISHLIERREGRAPKGLFAHSFAAGTGCLLVPIKVLALKNAFPDAGFLDSGLYYEVDGARGYGFGRRDVLAFKTRKYLDFYNYRKVFDAALESSKKGADCMTAFILASKLPNTKGVRKLLQGDIFSLGKVIFAKKLISNYDLFLNTVEFVRPLEKDELKLCIILKKIYGERIYSHVFQCKPGTRERIDWDDSVNMFFELSKQGKEAFFAERPKLSDLHDWLVKKRVTEDTDDYAFDIPEHIIKRMEMQIDRVKFFIPQTRCALEEAGRTLRNCVGSYHRRVNSGDCRIALLADDNGKLIAVIEVKDKTIVQAKINSNRAVSGNKEINQAVIDWAKKIGLKIKTHDIQTEKVKAMDNVVEMRVAAG